MFTNFHIERFRGIPHLDLDGVRPVTLLVGKNNTGKTTVLEAIFLLCGATNPYAPTAVGQLRGQRITAASDADVVWRSLFQELTGKVPIEIVGWQEGEGQRRLTIEPLGVTNYAQDVQDDSGRPLAVVEANGVQRIGGLRLSYVPSDHSGQVITQAVFDPQARQVVASFVQRDDFIRGTLLSARSFFNLSRDTEQYSFLVRIRQEQQVIQAIQLLDSRIQGLAVVSEASGATVYADIGGESLIPLAVCGEGMLRLFSIVLAITSTRGGVLLIDEIDNGLHYSIMTKFWPVLRSLCNSYRVQLIATTQNEEMLQGAIDAFRDDFNSFGLIRLDRTTTGVRAIRYDEEALHGVAEAGWEVRG